MTVKILQSLRSEENFAAFWGRVDQTANDELKWNIPHLHYHAKEGHVNDMILVQVKEIIQEMYKICTVVFSLKH